MAVDGTPTFYKMQIANDENEVSDEATLYFDQQSQVISEMVDQFNGGIQMAQKTNAQATAAGADTNVPLGTVWFNTDVAKLQVKTAASTVETVTST